VTTEPLALYVHWPFCVSKCPYCDFNSHVRSSIDQDEWRDALLADLAYEASLLPDRRLTSIFFGGGTPSLMDPATVSAIIGGAREHWQASEDIEITLEANPNSVEADRFADLAAAGVNRLSLGLQSFDDTALAFLGRAHSADEGQRALDIAQEHFPRVSFDLIYALPGDTETGWAKTLAENGASFLSAPAAFTKQTGEAHWHVLHRARAIETGSFMISAAQGGLHEDGRETYGHSVIIDPWGRVLADGGTEPGVFLAEIDTGLVAEVRGRIPTLKNARPFKVEVVPTIATDRAATA